MEIKQFFHETVSAYIDRFEIRKLQAENLGLPQNDIITRKTLFGFKPYVKVLESQLTEMRKENGKKMSLFEKIMGQLTSTPPSLLPPSIPRLERPRIVCSHCKGVRHPARSCWKLHPEKKPVKLGERSAKPSLI